MDIALTDEQSILKDSVANFCKSEVPMEKVRELADHPNGLTDELWQAVANQGWIGTMIPEEDGGLGLGVAEMAIIQEEMGRALLPGPFFSTAILAGPAIAMGGTAAAKAKYLEKIVSGELKATLGLLEEGAQLGAAYVLAEASRDGDNWTLNGKKFFVPDAVGADLFVIAARATGGDDGTALFIVESGADGVSIGENKLTDQTNRSGQVTLNNVKVGADAVVGNIGEGWAIVDKILLGANVCIAAQSITGAEKLFQITIEYVKERTQFGKAVGSFQAVAHPLADLYADLEGARSAYLYSAWAVSAETADAKAAAATARATCTQVYHDCTRKCLQAHGGIGFTWEYDLHFYMKRANHNEFFLGVPADYVEVVCKEALAI